MPKIKSGAELRNSYSEISKECHETGEPIFITKNASNDIIAIRNCVKYELYNKPAAVALMRKITKVIDSVSDFPEIF